MSSLQEKVNKINDYIKNKYYEEALNLYESLPSSCIQNFEDNKINIIKDLFYKLINQKNFDEAIRKIGNFKSKYSQHYSELKKIESKIYFNLALKEDKDGNFDLALRDFEFSASLDFDIKKSAKLNIIRILLFEKELYDKTLEEIKNFENYYGSNETIKNFKAAALNNKANIIVKNNVEEAINLLNKAIDIHPEKKIFETIRKHRLAYFKELFKQKLVDKNNLENIPQIFRKAKNFRYKSTEMDNYLNINIHLSNAFEILYMNKIHSKKTYEDFINNFLEFIRKGLYDENFELKYQLLEILFNENIEKDSDLFLIENREEKKDKSSKIKKKVLEPYEVLIKNINNYIEIYDNYDKFEKISSI